MNIAQVLTRLGLEDKEPDIYLTLLKTPGAQPASIIASRANLNRSTVYKALIKLVQKGLAAKTQRGGITCFIAEEPEVTLKTMVEEQQKQLEGLNQVILDSLPLLTRDGTEGTVPKIRYYEGIEGIKNIYEAMLKEGKDIYRYGDISKIYDALGPFTDEYIQKRNETGVFTHAIEPSTEEKGKMAEKHKAENREVLYIPHNIFPIEGEVRIFGNKVAIISLHKQSPLAVLIESATIAKMFYSIFMLTWEHYQKKS